MRIEQRLHHHARQSNVRRATARVAPTFFALLLLLLCSSCSFPWQSQGTQQPDPRLKLFHVLSERIVILDTQAEVDGTLQNDGHDAYPYDVTMIATFYNNTGQLVGQAGGVAEDVWPGMVRSFMLVGQVDSTSYSHMTIALVSLRERRVEKNLPTPPPITP
jgi:hypothetical protein